MRRQLSLNPFSARAERCVTERGARTGLGRPQKSRLRRQGRSTGLQTQEIAHAQCESEAVPRTAVVGLSAWRVENTCFGEILRGPCGTLLPPRPTRGSGTKYQNCLDVRT